MTQTHLRIIARLRILVAYLDERAQHNWWYSAFFDPTSPAFLQHVFTRTTFLAQYHGAQQAANMVHDQFVGMGVSPTVVEQASESDIPYSILRLLRQL